MAARALASEIVAGESGHKAYDATQSKRERAKRDGKSARSQELCGVAAFGTASLALFAVLGLLGPAIASGFALQLHAPANALPRAWLLCVLALALVPPIGAAAAATIVSFAQAGGMHLMPLKIAFDKLNPGAGVKRMLGAQAAVTALRAIVAFIVAVLAVTPIVRDTFARAGTLLDARAFGQLAQASAARVIAAVCVVGLVFAGIDYLLTRKKWLNDLKMTHDELKRDTKENDGDPHTHARRKSLHRQIVRGSVTRVREAAFVITNPTHIAIALKYDPPLVSVPQIVVRAAHDAAAQVRAMARDLGIPIVENVPLARALYASGEAGRPIANEHFVAVAQVIAELARAGVLS